MATRKVANAKQLPELTGIDPSTEEFLRAAKIVDAINLTLPDELKLPKIPRDYVFKKVDPATVANAFHAAFELVGGVPGLVKWGSESPTAFYNIYSKLLPPTTDAAPSGTTINIVSPIPASALDRVTIDETGRVCDIDDLPE
ncbi:MAG: hypothetical protein V5B36_00845 [Candidatus Accumulibacter sp. UW25]|jgi:hypothetical protein